MNIKSIAFTSLQHQRIHVQGMIQEFGVQPFPVELANEQGLSRSALNDELGMMGEVEGLPTDGESFIPAWKECAPVARINLFNHGYASYEKELTCA